MAVDAPAASLSTRRLAVLLGGLAMFGPFAIDTIFPAFPAIAVELGADKLAMQQTISVYLFAYALTSIVHGPLSDAIGRRKVILGGLSIFAAASVGCALATDFGTLLAFRAVQGLSAGVGLIVGRAVIRDVLHGDDAQRLMSQVSMIFGIAPAIAPIIGGWIIGWSHWSGIFWFLVAFATLLLIATWLMLPETNPPEARATLAPRRLLSDYLAIFANPRFQRLAAAAAFNFGALFLYIASAPAFVMGLMDLTARQFGWFFVPMIGGMILGAWMSGRTAGRIGRGKLVSIGFACSAVAAVLNVGYNLWTDAPQLPWAVIPISLNAFGIALVSPIVTLSILDMYPRRRGSASSLQAFTALVSNALIAGVVSPLVSGSGLSLALVAAGLVALGWAFWRWECGVSRASERRARSAAAMPGPGESL